METKGYDRERSLPPAEYYADSYFDLQQLCSFAHQIHDINALSPKTIIEIGIGNGFTSTFLKRSGYDVVTVDINPSLGPDICSSIAELQSRLGDQYFDLVVCCEVLEHMPFDEFERNIRVLSSIGKRLYMTLPNYRRAFGFGGFLKLPRVLPFLASFHVQINTRKPLASEHFWEVGMTRETGKEKIVGVLRKYYTSIAVDSYALNPYHMSFHAVRL